MACGQLTADQSRLVHPRNRGPRSLVVDAEGSVGDQDPFELPESAARLSGRRELYAEIASCTSRVISGDGSTCNSRRSNRRYSW
jgi:hypothetical protein